MRPSEGGTPLAWNALERARPSDRRLDEHERRAAAALATLYRPPTSETTSTDSIVAADSEASSTVPIAIEWSWP